MVAVNSSVMINISMVNDEPPVLMISDPAVMFTEDGAPVMIIAPSSTITDADDTASHRMVTRVCASVTNPYTGDLVNSSAPTTERLNNTNICVSLESCGFTNTTCVSSVLNSIVYDNTEDEPDLADRIITITVTQMLKYEYSNDCISISDI